MFDVKIAKSACNFANKIAKQKSPGPHGSGLSKSSFIYEK